MSQLNKKSLVSFVVLIKLKPPMTYLTTYALNPNKTDSVIDGLGIWLRCSSTWHKLELVL